MRTIGTDVSIINKYVVGQRIYNKFTGKYLGRVRSINHKGEIKISQNNERPHLARLSHIRG